MSISESQKIASCHLTSCIHTSSSFQAILVNQLYLSATYVWNCCNHECIHRNTETSQVDELMKDFGKLLINRQLSGATQSAVYTKAPAMLVTTADSRLCPISVFYVLQIAQVDLFCATISTDQVTLQYLARPRSGIGGPLFSKRQDRDWLSCCWRSSPAC